MCVLFSWCWPAADRLGCVRLQRSKYLRKEFGECPRVYCQGQAVVPVRFVGCSDALTILHVVTCSSFVLSLRTQMGTCADPNLDIVRVFCPRCEEIYSCTQPNHVYLDGAYFGPTFPHLFFISFEELVPEPPVRIEVRVCCVVQSRAGNRLT